MRNRGEATACAPPRFRPLCTPCVRASDSRGHPSPARVRRPKRLADDADGAEAEKGLRTGQSKPHATPQSRDRLFLVQNQGPLFTSHQRARTSMWGRQQAAANVSMAAGRAWQPRHADRRARHEHSHSDIPNAGGCLRRAPSWRRRPSRSLRNECRGGTTRAPHPERSRIHRDCLGDRCPA